MLSTNSTAHIAMRAGLGFSGATIVVLPAFLNWMDATDPLNAPKLAVWGYGGVLLIAWILSICITAWEPEKHWWACFLKSIGLPALFVSLGALSQVPN